jgi:hypothetical protein
MSLFLRFLCLYALNLQEFVKKINILNPTNTSMPKPYFFRSFMSLPLDHKKREAHASLFL